MKDLLIELLRASLQRFIFPEYAVDFDPDLEEGDLDDLEVDFYFDPDDAEVIHMEDPEEREGLVWILSESGLKQVFAIARSEEDDDMALMEVVANTSWSDPEDFEDEEDYS